MAYSACALYTSSLLTVDLCAVQAAAFSTGSKYDGLGLPLPPRAIPARRVDKKPAIKRKVSFASSWTSELSDRFAPFLPCLPSNWYIFVTSMHRLQDSMQLCNNVLEAAIPA